MVHSMGSLLKSPKVTGGVITHILNALLIKMPSHYGWGKKVRLECWPDFPLLFQIEFIIIGL